MAKHSVGSVCYFAIPQTDVWAIVHPAPGVENENIALTPFLPPTRIMKDSTNRREQFGGGKGKCDIDIVEPFLSSWKEEPRGHSGLHSDSLRWRSPRWRCL